MRCRRASGTGEGCFGGFTEGRSPVGRTDEEESVVECDYRTVHRQLSELAELGVVEWTDAKPGTAKKPQFPYDGLEIDLDLVDDDRPDPATD